MTTSVWGPTTWIFFHTLAEKIKENGFSIIGPNLILIIIQICNNLPCPDCAGHAKTFWSKVNVANIKTKSDLINLLFVFHNMVNQRKGIRPFKHCDLSYYKTKNLVDTYNKFAANFNTRGNMNLLTESFHRTIMMAKLRGWLMKNINFFNP
jgi:hypothetical protein